VTLTFSDGSGALTTDENGSFYRELSNGWNGTITPSKDGYSFSPSNIAISSHSSHSVSHVLVGSRDSVLYVDCDATGTGDGSTWANAYTDLSEALSSERVFTEVWVAEGTYLPGEIRSSFFLLPPNIAVYGGFAGTETSRDQRDTVINLTILSGDIGILNDNSDNCFHVVVPSNGSSLDGFRIMGGYANKNYSDDDRGKGAGLWADEVNFSVNDCNFTNNSTYQGGSGVYLYDSNATFENCVFTQNSTLSTGSGGAAYFQDSNISITNSIFKSNSAYYWGGAIRSENSTLSISGSQFLENQSLSSNGAGAVMINDGNFSINFTSFTSNQATHDGGALLIVSAGGSIIDSNFTSNLNTQWNGGGALKLESSSPNIQNCIFSYNRTQANHYGGAINLESSSPTIESCTFTRNKSESNSAGALYIDSSSDPVLRNNNFYFNYASSWGGAIFAVNPSFSVEGGVFHGNWANLGGGVATNGSVQSVFNSIRMLGNEANSSSTSNGGFAFFNTGSTGSTFINCEIIGNKANNRDGVFAPKGNTKFLNCSIVRNEAGSLGGVALLFTGDSITLENTIMWENSSPQGNDIYVNQGTASANYSLFDSSQSIGSVSGSNNASGNPLFVDAAGADNIYGTEDDDLRLQSSSPAINQASDAVSDYPSTDINGFSRNGAPDIGANEFYSASAPVFSSAASFSAAENQTGVGTVTATDANGDALTFSISGGLDQSLFTINATTGVLVFNSAPDYENAGDNGGDNIYNLTIQVSDGSLTATQNLTITVTDVNETPANSAPLFSSVASFSGAENQTGVGTVTATDANGDALTFSISGGLDQSLFTINATTGVLVFNSAPDYENAGDNGGDNIYNLTIQVSDGSLTATQNLTITITDVNETPANSAPSGLSTSGSLVMQENEAVGTIVGTFTAQDPDGDSLYYYLASGMGDGNNSMFTMDTNGTLRTAMSFDYESYQSLNISVVVLDDSNASAVGSFSVAVTNANEAPTALGHSSALSVLENQASGTIVGTFTAQDPDGDSLTYHLVSGTGDGNNSMFTMDTNGTLRTAMSFDYESYQSLNIRVSAMDGNSSSAEGAFSVMVANENEAPTTLGHSSALSVLENQASGTIVGTFTAQDPDGDSLTYHLVSGTGDGNNSMFTMDANGTLRTAMSFDYELYRSLNIRVSAMDDSSFSVEGAFTVDILNDLGSVFSVSGGSFSHPFYQFVDGNGLAVDFSSLLLNRGEIYEFKANGVLNSHPFMIGESNGDLSSSLVTGGPLTASLGSIFLTIPSDFSGSLYYFCTAHTSMVAPIGFNTGNQAPTNLTI
jgi:hypothetical protein